MSAIIELENLRYAYPEMTSPALDIDHVAIEKGEFCCLVGRTGAGKSTFCRTLVGLVPHSFQGTMTGSARVAGLDVVSSTITELSTHVGFVMDDPFDQLTRSTYSVREEIAFGLQNMGMPVGQILEKVLAVMRELEIDQLADRLPTELSGGQQQRVAIASIFVVQPEILILDEATSQLDPQGCEEIYRAARHCKEIGKTVIMVEPKLDKVLQYADRLLVFDQGRIVASGTCENIFNSDVLPNLGLDLPAYPSLGLQLRDLGFYRGTLPISTQEACTMVKEALHGNY